jgi:hypothetical protein
MGHAAASFSRSERPYPGAGDVSSTSFDPDALIEEARAATGLSDLGEGGIRERLAVLCETYEHHVWDEAGRRRNRRRVLGLLSTRLRVEAALRAHPEILDRPLGSPMVLTGLPRSGTSALFNLLAADPAARPLLLWETQFPDPAAGLAEGEDDPRHLAMKRYYEDAQKKNPEFTKMHFASADTPEECVLLQSYAWYREQDLGPMYAYYRKLLQLLDWQRPGERWLLKTPAHMWAIEALIEHFPDVSIVWSHRDPGLCVASICSMTSNLLRGCALDDRDLGPIVMDFYATSLERGLEARDRCDPARFLDVSHDDFVADALGVALRIYGHFGLPVSARARAALESHVAANPRGKHGRHDYSLDQYGLEPGAVLKRFEGYIERFGVETGRSTGNRGATADPGPRHGDEEGSDHE